MHSDARFFPVEHANTGVSSGAHRLGTSAAWIVAAGAGWACGFVCGIGAGVAAGAGSDGTPSDSASISAWLAEGASGVVAPTVEADVAGGAEVDGDAFDCSSCALATLLGWAGILSESM